MSFGRRNFSPRGGESTGPSDEMLAVDAASEIRSLTLLYDRYADRLYRFFLVCTGDPRQAERMLRRLIRQLPGELQRYNREEQTFAGWLFARASALVWREHSVPSRIRHWISRFTGRESDDMGAFAYSSVEDDHLSASLDQIFRGLARIGPTNREALGLTLGAGLSTMPASEAMRLPASLLTPHVQSALHALAGEIGATNIPVLRQHLEEELGQQHLTSDQRGTHLALIHGLFHGDLHLEPDEPARGPALEIVVLVAIVIIGLGGIWIWGEVTTGDTRQHDVPVSSDDDGVGAASAANTPEPTATADPVTGEQIESDSVSETCLAADGMGAFHRFVTRFNDGDFETVQAMLPGADYDHPLVAGDAASADVLQSLFSHHDVRLAHVDQIAAYLRDRHDAGERWEVLEAYEAEHYRNWSGAEPLAMYQDWKRENPGLSMVIVSGMRWISPDGQEEIASGQVVVDCANELIIQWDLRRNDSQTGEPVGVDEFMAAMEPVEPHEAREIRARVQTDERADTGGLSTWEVIWSEAADPEGELRERIDIRRLDGTNEISYVDDGNRWRLNWRGWVVYGDADDEEQPVPEEIAQSVPWLRAMAELIVESPEVAESMEPTTLTRDFSDTTENDAERWFEVEIENGDVHTARILEIVQDRERKRPELTVLGVSRSTGYDPGRYEVGMEPPFPESDPNASQYEVPDDDWPELRVISMSVGNNPIREQYRLSWNNAEFDLAVWPSRGGVDLASVPESVDGSWVTAVTRYSHGALVWAHRQFAGYPTDALWDDGRYRFELALDRSSMQPEYDWNLNELIRLADALSSSEGESSLVYDRGRGRSSRYPVPSMFNY